VLTHSPSSAVNSGGAFVTGCVDADIGASVRVKVVGFEVRIRGRRPMGSQERLQTRRIRECGIESSDEEGLTQSLEGLKSRVVRPKKVLIIAKAVKAWWLRTTE
jgi:hypothetical protein